MKKIKLNESDVSFMINEVVKRITKSLTEEGGLNNAAKRIAVIRNA